MQAEIDKEREAAEIKLAGKAITHVQSEQGIEAELKKYGLSEAAHKELSEALDAQEKIWEAEAAAGLDEKVIQRRQRLIAELHNGKAPQKRDLSEAKNGLHAAELQFMAAKAERERIATPKNTPKNTPRGD